MKFGLRKSLLAGVLVGSWSPVAPLCAQMPPAIAVSGEAIVATFHAEGAQLYECRLDLGNKLVWQVREPIAALILDGKTIGLHYAGPNWQHVDGSSVRAKMVAAPQGAIVCRALSLNLEDDEQHGKGLLPRVKPDQHLLSKGLA